jgi:cell division GTPase FtsZ
VQGIIKVSPITEAEQTTPARRSGSFFDRTGQTGQQADRAMTLNLTMPQQGQDLKPRITVFGVGGAGGNAVNNMISTKP